MLTGDTTNAGDTANTGLFDWLIDWLIGKCTSWTYQWSIDWLIDRDYIDWPLLIDSFQLLHGKYTDQWVIRIARKRDDTIR